MVYPMPDSLNNKSKLIVYIDTVGCSKCRISRLIRYEELFRLSKSSGAFELVVMISTKEKEREAIIEHLSLINLPFPVYIDKNNNYLKMNPLLSDNERFYNLCINKEGLPIYIGDPTSGPDWMELFKNVIL